jgi:excisionase family DNA binding protein
VVVLFFVSVDRGECMPNKIERQPAAVRRFRLGDWMSVPEWVSVKEAAELSGYDVQHVQRLLRQRKVNAEKKGGREWWIDKSGLQTYVQAMKSLGSEKHNPHRTGD